MVKNALIGLVAVGVVGIAAPAQAGLCATVWQHRDFRGDMEQLQDGVRGPRIGDWGDKISSVFVEPNCMLNVWQHPEFGGEFRSFTPGPVAYVGDWWNDSISSFVCTCN
jgi:hypothetical protein